MYSDYFNNRYNNDLNHICVTLPRMVSGIADWNAYSTL